MTMLHGRQVLRAPVPTFASPTKAMLNAAIAQAAPLTRALFDTAIVMLAEAHVREQDYKRRIEQLTAEVEKLQRDLTELQVRVCRRENATHALMLMERDVRIARALEAVRVAGTTLQ